MSHHGVSRRFYQDTVKKGNFSSKPIGLVTMLGAKLY
jgi:hypothetical protein